MITAPQAVPQPVNPTERNITLDIIRGVALFGILLVNMAFFKSDFTLIPVTEWNTPLDQAASFAIRWLAEGKFYVIFSFLFGLGFALQLQRAKERGNSAIPSFLRRLLALLVIGISHAVLLWYGDILVTYALLGLLLVIFYDCKSRTLLIWAGVFPLLSLLALGGVAALFALIGMIPEAATAMQAQTSPDMLRQQADIALNVYRGNDYGAILLHRLGVLVFVVPFAIMLQGGIILAMFLCGMWVGKRGVVNNIGEHHHLLRRMLWIGLAIGLPLNLAYVLLYDPLGTMLFTPLTVLTSGLLMVGGPLLGGAYVAGLALLTQHERWAKLLAPVASVGRMPLTNYLMQTLICTTLFYGYGFGLFGQVGPAAGILITLAIYAVQLVLSRLWLRRFAYGPAEWVWRRLSYGRAPQTKL